MTIPRKMIRDMWACAVAPQALADAEALNIPPWVLETIIQAFYNAGDYKHPDQSPFVVRMRGDEWGNNKFRLKLPFSVTARYRGLIVDVEMRAGHALVLAGIFERCEETYTEAGDMHSRCNKLGL